MTTKTFRVQAAQGDIWFRRVSEMPAEARMDPRRLDDPLIVAHSEDGHHHVFQSEKVERYSTNDPLRSFLRVLEPADLTHLRGFDTHTPIRFDPGIYEVRRGRELNPWTGRVTRVQD